MDINIRHAKDYDIEHILSFSKKLCDYSRANHDIKCKYDDYELVTKAIVEKVRTAFQNRDENTLYLVAESDQIPLGYVFAKIYEETQTADNGTGRVGLLDELFVDEKARSMGLGQKMIDETIKWFQANNICRVKLHAYSWNQSAKTIYEKNGFTEYAVSYEKFI